MSEEKDTPMIPKHQAQAEMMHMSWTIRWLVIAVVVGFLSMVVMAYIFVNGYTSRTKDWLKHLLAFAEPAGDCYGGWK